MATRVKTDPPRGHDEIVTAALAAAERLFAQTSPHAVSMRAISDEAKITYSLLHRHLGTKADIIEEMLTRSESRWRTQIGDTSAAEALAILLGPDREAGPYMRLLAWSLLEKETVFEAERSHAALDELVPALQREESCTPDEAAVRVATALAAVFGWRFFSPFITQALDFDDQTAEATHARIGGLVDDVVAGAAQS